MWIKIHLCFTWGAIAINSESGFPIQNITLNFGTVCHAAKESSIILSIVLYIPDVWLLSLVNKILNSSQWAIWGSIDNIFDHFFPPFCCQLPAPHWCCVLLPFINIGFQSLQYAGNTGKRREVISSEHCSWKHGSSINPSIFYDFHCKQLCALCCCNWNVCTLNKFCDVPLQCMCPSWVVHNNSTFLGFLGPKFLHN